MEVECWALSVLINYLENFLGFKEYITQVLRG